MRFSAIFQLPLPPKLVAAGQPVPVGKDGPAAQQPAVVPVPAPAAVPEAAPADDLDLDQRVRLIGEWQLGEGA